MYEMISYLYSMLAFTNVLYLYYMFAFTEELSHFIILMFLSLAFLFSPLSLFVSPVWWNCTVLALLLSKALDLSIKSEWGPYSVEHS